MSTRTVALALAIALAACGSPRKPPAPRPNTPKAAGNAAPIASAAPAAAAPAEPDFVYTSVGTRDPFRSYLADLVQETSTFANRCPTPLGKFDIEQLKLVAVIIGLEDPVAMVEAPSGIGYSVRRGACVGKNGGVVAAVRSGEVVVSEWAIRADGTRDQTKTVLKLPKPEINLEE